jgi:hypothetical protein
MIRNPKTTPTHSGKYIWIKWFIYLVPFPHHFTFGFKKSNMWKEAQTVAQYYPHYKQNSHNVHSANKSIFMQVVICDGDLRHAHNKDDSRQNKNHYWFLGRYGIWVHKSICSHQLRSSVQSGFMRYLNGNAFVCLCYNSIFKCQSFMLSKVDSGIQFVC